MWKHKNKKNTYKDIKRCKNAVKCKEHKKRKKCKTKRHKYVKNIFKKSQET